MKIIDTHLLYTIARSLGLCLFLATQTPIVAQNWNQIVKAVASDRATDDKFGYAVAISGDYAVVGANQEDQDVAGGATLSNAGAAYILKRTGTTWAQEAKIVANDRAANDNFGFSVAINGDYVTVAANGDDNGAGSAYIFKRTGSTWAQEAKIVANDRAASDYFGRSVAISGDYAVVGAYFEDENATGGATLSNAGSAYIFKRTGTTWAQEAKIVPADRSEVDLFGNSVAISGDYVLVGASYGTQSAAFEGAGAAYIFKRSGTTWAQEARIVASDRAANDRFGTSVAISGDYAVVGADAEDPIGTGGATLMDAGAAYIFKRTGTTWAQEAKIVASDRAQFDNFGGAVAVSGDYVVVGASTAASGAGTAYVFKRAGTTWAQDARIVASDRAANDFFGKTVAINGDYVLIGADGEDENATGGARLIDAGSVYFFNRTTTPVVDIRGVELLKLYPSVTRHFLNVETTEIADYQVFNLLGQQVLNGKTGQRIDVSALQTGTYVVRMGLAQAKFVKQ